jgi:hypothetical protein
MDPEQIAVAFKRLRKGRDVGVPFDPGDEDMAGGMMRKLAAMGMESELCDDIRHGREGARLPSWFIQYIAGGCLALLALWLAAARLPAGAMVLNVIVGMTLLFIASIPVLDRLHRDSLLTEEARDEEQKRQSRLRLWFFAVLVPLGVIIENPWFAVPLLAIGVGGIGCAIIIRAMTRRAGRRPGLLDEFDPDDHAG